MSELSEAINELMTEAAETDLSDKVGFYIIMHKGTKRSVVSGPYDQAKATKLKQGQGRDGMYFGLNQDHDLLYFNGKSFMHTDFGTGKPNKNRYSNDPHGLLLKSLEKK